VIRWGLRSPRKKEREKESFVDSKPKINKLPTQEAEYSFSGFIPTNEQTNKQITRTIQTQACSIRQIKASVS